MNTDHTLFFQGNKIEILEMFLENIDNKLELSWKIYFGNTFLKVTFNNVTRFKFGEFSTPLEVHGFEIINHSQSGWEKESAYEIRDFEDDSVHFFCECFRVDD